MTSNSVRARPAERTGPLAGLRVVEMAGLGPIRMCAMLLADLGATVLKVDRLEASGLGIDIPRRFSVQDRSRAGIALDLKTPVGRDAVLRLSATADALIEGYRPGVMERLGLGPDACMAGNARLIYGRLTGWGQDGPLSQAAGHDLNYIALTGVLDSIGRAGQPPTPPLNLVGDYGGGSLFLALGVVSGILAARTSGRGQVVDAAMIDGAASLMSAFYAAHAAGRFGRPRGENLLDSGAFFYDVYECADGRYVSVAPIEAKFLRILLERLDLDPALADARTDEGRWAETRRTLADLFRTRPREAWRELLEGTDACFAPVLSLDEAPQHPHNIARQGFVTVDDVVHPAPAPRFGDTALSMPTAPEEPDGDALLDWGFADDEIAALRRDGVLR